MYDEHYVALLTSLAASQRRLLVEYYARMDEVGRVEAHRRQREVFKDWLAQGRTANNRAGETNYAALLMALKSILVDEQRQLPTAVSDEQQTINKPRKQRKQQLRSSLEKRYMSELVRLREEEKLSWRQLSDYFRKQFRKTVSHTYLKRIYEDHYAAQTS